MDTSEQGSQVMFLSLHLYLHTCCRASIVMPYLQLYACVCAYVCVCVRLCASVCAYVCVCVPYHADENNRVVLDFIRGVEGSDYINASYVDVSI